jgi:polysaccharide pyruvyl transferase WcaK-like protein
LEQTLTNPKICLFGAAPDTGNLGVSALFYSTLNAVARWAPDVAFTAFDHGHGVRKDEVWLQDRLFAFTRIGANLSRRYYRRDNLLVMRISAAIGGVGNPGLRAIREADAVLDISGGDSFADIYGLHRFRAITLTKRLTIDLGSPLYLLPQTYGPYDAPSSQKIAREIVHHAAMATARDERSFEVLRELLAANLDSARHSVGVDVAFALPSREPEDVPDWYRGWVKERERTPVIGFNASGLIYNQGAAGSKKFGFRGDYREIVLRVLRRFLDHSDANIILVPHVLTRRAHYEDDVTACQEVAATLNADARIKVLNISSGAMETKWAISGLDFFCGTRMHSTIAGLSSGVPTAAIAYSDKTLGVFETCDQGNCVVDPRKDGVDDCVEAVWQIWSNRAHHAASLRARLPSVVQKAVNQFERIFEMIESDMRS